MQGGKTQKLGESSILVWKILYVSYKKTSWSRAI